MSVFWRRFIVNHQQYCSIFLGHFAVSTPTIFFNFVNIFLFSPTSEQSDFLLKYAVRTVCRHIWPQRSRSCLLIPQTRFSFWYNVHTCSKEGLIIIEPHRWRNSKHARLECGRSWVWTLLRSNQIFIKLVFAASLRSTQH